MKLATISTVFALGALAACAGVPDETLVASYGDTGLIAASPSETSPEKPAPEAAASQAADAPATVTSAELEDEKPGPGALAFSPAQEGGEATPEDVSVPEDQDAQVASLPKPDEEPAAEETASLPKQDAEPAAEETAALPQQDAEPAAKEAAALREPAAEETASLPKQDAEPAAEETAALPQQDAEPAAEDTGTPAESAARTPEQPVVQPAAQAPGPPYGVQLAAYRQASGAEAVWNGLLRAHPDLFAELSKTIRRADLGATRGVVHQLRVGPFAGEAEARAFCDTLKKRGTDCFIVAPRISRRP